MNEGVFGALTITFSSAAQKKAWLALPLDAGRPALTEAGIEVEDSELFGNELIVKAKSLKEALATLEGTGLTVEKRNVGTWAKVEHEGAPSIAIKTKGELSEKTDGKTWLAWLKKHAKAGDTFYGVDDKAKRVAIHAYFDNLDAYAHVDESFALAASTAAGVGATVTLGFVGDTSLLDEAIYRGVRSDAGKLASTRYDEAQDLTEALYTALLQDHGVNIDAIRAGRAAWLDTHIEKKLLMERRGNSGIMRPDGTFLVEPRYGGLGALEDGRAMFRSSAHLWGYLDEHGEVLVEPKFFQAHDFKEGLARVRFETERVQLSETSAQMTWKFGFIDRSGAYAIPPVHEEVEDFAGDRAMIKLNGKYGYLDRSGALVIPATYDFATAFSEGLALVCVGDRYAGGRWGFIDSAGKFVIEPTLVSAGAFMAGQAPFMDERQLWGAVDSTGKVVVSPRYQSAAFVQNGRVVARTAEGWGVFSPTGEAIIPPTFHRIEARGPLFEAMHKDVTRELYTRDGARVGALRVADNGDFGEDRIAVQLEAGAPWGYVGMQGEWAIEPRYERAFPFGRGRAVVEDEKGLGIIDTSGEVVARPNLQSGVSYASAFGSSGLAMVTRWSKSALVREDGQVVVPYHLSGVFGLNASMVWVQYATND
jgi:hypothetical protein